MPFPVEVGAHIAVVADVQPARAMPLLGDRCVVKRPLADLDQANGALFAKTGGIVERHTQDADLSRGVIAPRPAPETAVGGLVGRGATALSIER